ncbi:MAG: Coenzyme biosynthesis bifunctional protein CoaBC [Verrucomicrobiota bacterium]
MSPRPPCVLLGVTGSIAAYKAAELVGLLVRMPCEVHVIMTRSAQQFITPLTFQCLSRNPVLLSSFSETSEWKPAHIELADRADLLLIAPASANILAELAHGMASHPLTEIALACRAPLLIAPAMNGKMWSHPATQHNTAILKERGAEFIGPDSGMLACGYEGAGRLCDPQVIAARVSERLGNRGIVPESA